MNDYVYMCTNNAIISNNQSKDLNALWCLHVKSKALTPFTCNFHYSYYLLRIVVHFFTAIISIPHFTAQMMDSERAGVFTGCCFNLFRSNLMHNDFVWLYSTLFRRHRNVMEFVCLYTAVAFSSFLDEGKEQRLVAASCVFPRNAMLSSPPSFLICVLIRGVTIRVSCIRGRPICVFQGRCRYRLLQIK